MMLDLKINPQTTAAIGIDCLNTFLKKEGALSIAQYQSKVLGLEIDHVQTQLDACTKRMHVLRHLLYEAKIPQIQFQDAHVIESIHGKRFHSLEIARPDETIDFKRKFPAHALLEHHRKFGTLDQQAVDDMRLSKLKQVIVPWHEDHYPIGAQVHDQIDLIFYKDDFSMNPGSPFVGQLFWELRRQMRFDLIVFGVCDEICNLRNCMQMLSALFRVIYVEDCTYSLLPEMGDKAVRFLEQFNAIGLGQEASFVRVKLEDLIEILGRF